MHGLRSVSAPLWWRPPSSADARRLQGTAHCAQGKRSEGEREPTAMITARCGNAGGGEVKTERAVNGRQYTLDLSIEGCRAAAR